MDVSGETRGKRKDGDDLEEKAFKHLKRLEREKRKRNKDADQDEGRMVGAVLDDDGGVWRNGYELYEVTEKDWDVTVDVTADVDEDVWVEDWKEADSEALDPKMVMEGRREEVD